MSLCILDEENPSLYAKDETGTEEKTANDLLKEKEDAESVSLHVCIF